MCGGLRSITDVVVRTLIHPPTPPQPTPPHVINVASRASSKLLRHVLSTSYQGRGRQDINTPPHPPHPPNHILSMCGHHENRNAYTVVEIRATKNKNIYIYILYTDFP